MKQELVIYREMFLPECADYENVMCEKKCHYSRFQPVSKDAKLLNLALALNRRWRDSHVSFSSVIA